MSRLKWLIVAIGLLIIVSGIVIAYTWFADLYGGDICAAVKANDLSVVKTLLRLGRNVNENHGRPLYLAANYGRVKMASYLISQGANVNMADNSGLTPLHRAASAWAYEALQGKNRPKDLDEISLDPPSEDDYIKVVSLLLANGARANVKNFAGDTPLHYAYNSKIIQLLMSHGALINARNKQGQTPLFVQSCLFKYDNVKLLISKGADINVCDFDYGDTALHRVAMRGDISMAELLIKHGARTNIKNKKGETQLSCALKHHFGGVAKILQEYCAKPSIN